MQYFFHQGLPLPCPKEQQTVAAYASQMASIISSAKLSMSFSVGGDGSVQSSPNEMEGRRRNNAGSSMSTLGLSRGATYPIQSTLIRGVAWSKIVARCVPTVLLAL